MVQSPEADDEVGRAARHFEVAGRTSHDVVDGEAESWVDVVPLARLDDSGAVRDEGAKLHPERGPETDHVPPSPLGEVCEPMSSLLFRPWIVAAEPFLTEFDRGFRLIGEPGNELIMGEVVPPQFVPREVLGHVVGHAANLRAAMEAAPPSGLNTPALMALTLCTTAALEGAELRVFNEGG